MSRAVLTFSPDDAPNQVALLRLVVETPSFSGVGEAWAWIDPIQQFADRLLQFPISNDKPPELIFGYGLQRVDDRVLSLKIIADDQRGTLRVIANVSDYADRMSKLTTHFETHYPDVERFQRQLISMITGQRTEAVLDGS